MVDDTFTLILTLKNGLTLTGTVNIAENAQGGTAAAENVVLTIGRVAHGL